ncbi:MAG: HAD family hydrolase [Lentimicrobium sp.]
MQKKAVIFDLGGVLIDWNPRYVYRKIFDNEADTEWFLENICTSDWNLSIDAGKPFAEAVKELSVLNPEWVKQIEAFHLRWEEMLGGDIPESVQILKEIQNAGYPVLGLTNWSAETFPIAYDRFEFLQTFDGIVVSGAEKLIKPDPRIYNVLLDRYGLQPVECLFIDDNLHNVTAARDLGFDTIHYTSSGQLKDELQQREIL